MKLKDGIFLNLKLAFMVFDGGNIKEFFNRIIVCFFNRLWMNCFKPGIEVDGTIRSAKPLEASLQSPYMDSIDKRLEIKEYKMLLKI